MSLNFSEIVLYLALYSIAGWICEVIYCSIPARKFINRGFLHGPYCIIYGIGATILLSVATPIMQYPPLVFLISLLAATILEYFTSWLMEAIFQIRWWNYSHKKYQLRGRICLQNSLLFGLMGVFTVYLLHPLATDLMGLIPGDRQRVLASAVLAIFLLDLIFTLNALLKLSVKLSFVQDILRDLENHVKTISWFQWENLAESMARLKELSRKGEIEESLTNILVRWDSAAQNWKRVRLEAAFPHLKAKNLGRELNITLDHFQQLLAQEAVLQKESWQNRILGWTKKLRQRTASEAKEAAHTFAEGLNGYKLLWVFAVASVIGYIIETLFCLITQGMIESRQGLLYGPFSQVYGFGAVLMVLLLTPLAKKSDRWLFLGSAILGGAFEFLCSLVQEAIFGTVSWDYSAHSFSIGGRTSLTYMFFWGILGIFFMRAIYPALSRLIESIPKRQGIFFSWVLILSFTVNMFLSGTAVYRWAERQSQIAPTNAYERFLDRHYPNERLEEIYPNMVLQQTSHIIED